MPLVTPHTQCDLPPVPVLRFTPSPIPLTAPPSTLSALLSRQFRPLPRSRIDSLLSSFPKLIPPGSQHTTVETPDVRFVYQVFEEFYVLLVVNKGSNILQVSN